jgi:hypothetical protein
VCSGFLTSTQAFSHYRTYPWEGLEVAEAQSDVGHAWNVPCIAVKLHLPWVQILNVVNITVFYIDAGKMVKRR